MLTEEFEFVKGSLDSFNDILRGGFGVFEDEPIKIVFVNTARIMEMLGHEETIRYYDAI